MVARVEPQTSEYIVIITIQHLTNIQLAVLQHTVNNDRKGKIQIFSGKAWKVQMVKVLWGQRYSRLPRPRKMVDLRNSPWTLGHKDLTRKAA